MRNLSVPRTFKREFQGRELVECGGLLADAAHMQSGYRRVSGFTYANHLTGRTVENETLVDIGTDPNFFATQGYHRKAGRGCRYSQKWLIEA